VKIFSIISLFLSFGLAVRFKDTPLFYFTFWCTLFWPATYLARLIFPNGDYQVYIINTIYLIVILLLYNTWKKQYKIGLILFYIAWTAFGIEPKILFFVSVTLLTVFFFYMMMVEREIKGLRIVYLMFMLEGINQMLMGVAQFVGNQYAIVMTLIIVIMGYLCDIIAIISGYEAFIFIPRKLHVIDESQFDNLTHREIEVLQLIGEGLSTEQIAKKLFLSKRTVDAHRSHIKSKIGTTTVTETAIYGHDHNK